MFTQCSISPPLIRCAAANWYSISWDDRQSVRHMKVEIVISKGHERCDEELVVAERHEDAAIGFERGAVCEL